MEMTTFFKGIKQEYTDSKSKHNINVKWRLQETDAEHMHSILLECADKLITWHENYIHGPIWDKVLNHAPGKKYVKLRQFKHSGITAYREARGQAKYYTHYELIEMISNKANARLNNGTGRLEDITVAMLKRYNNYMTYMNQLEKTLAWDKYKIKIQE